MIGQVVQHGLVRFPAVRELGRDVEVYRLGGGMGVEKVCDAGPGHEDACVAVAGGQHAESAGFEVKRGGVPATREGVARS